MKETCRRELERELTRIRSEIATSRAKRGSGSGPVPGVGPQELTDRQRRNIAEIAGCDPDDIGGEGTADSEDPPGYKRSPSRVVPFNAGAKSPKIGDGLTEDATIQNTSTLCACSWVNVALG
jgi:hypothetical protein